MSSAPHPTRADDDVDARSDVRAAAAAAAAAAFSSSSSSRRSSLTSFLEIRSGVDSDDVRLVVSVRRAVRAARFALLHSALAAALARARAPCRGARRADDAIARAEALCRGRSRNRRTDEETARCRPTTFHRNLREDFDQNKF
jgi:hypothetical protein